MNYKMKWLLLCMCAMAVTASAQPSFDVGKALDYCAAQARKTGGTIGEGPKMPRSVPKGEKEWKRVDIGDWTSGFWPGIQWYLFDATDQNIWKLEAHYWQSYLEPLSHAGHFDHDLGFQVFCSYGNGYRLTKDPKYKEVILRTADSLATLYNPKVGTTQSWPHNNYGGHNTIIDNMMNLELLFWASKNGGNKKLYDIAVRHAETTMRHHFREDYSSYHVVVYDPETGMPFKKLTAQGFSDESMWARGQAWAIYGFTMTYRETGDPKFLAFAEKVAGVYLERLPDDLVPFWDFMAPGIPNEPRDAAAAAIAASGLLELSTLATDAERAKRYRSKAEGMLAELSRNYQSREANSAFLLHATGHKPAGSEIDCSIIYADYYYLEALLRLRDLRAKP